MAKCPSCGSSVAWNAKACTKCDAAFGEGGWRPLADSPEEEGALNMQYPNAIPQSDTSAGDLFVGMAKAIAMLPIIPALLALFIAVSCGLFGVAFGFSCAGGSMGDGTWTTAIQTYGVLGWLLSLPAAGMLALVGLFLRSRRD
jgi:hypothetical protein